MHELEYPFNRITAQLSRFIHLMAMALFLALALPGYSDEAIEEKVSLFSSFQALEGRLLEIEQQLAQLEAQKEPPPNKTALVVELNREIIRLTDRISALNEIKMAKKKHEIALSYRQLEMLKELDKIGEELAPTIRELKELVALQKTRETSDAENRQLRTLMDIFYKRRQTQDELKAEVKKLDVEIARSKDDEISHRSLVGTPIEEVMALLPPSGTQGVETLLNQYQDFFRGDRAFTEFEKNNGLLRFGAGAGETVGEMRELFVQRSLEKFPKGDLSELDYREICANAFNAMFSANLLAASKKAPAAERGKYVSVGLFGLSVFRNNPLNQKAKFWYDGITTEFEPLALKVLEGEATIRIQPGDAYGHYLADIVAGRRNFDALTAVDALARDLDHIVREHPAELALTAAILGNAFSGLNKGFAPSEGKASGVSVSFRIGDSRLFDSLGQTMMKVRVSAPVGVSVTNNDGSRVFLYADANEKGVAGSYRFSIDYKQHRMIKEGYSGQFNGAFELPPGFKGSFVVNVALDSEKIEVIQTN